MQFENMINTIQFGDCYELIKNIPDKSIDCIYVDVPYLYVSGGAGTSEISKRSTKNKMELLGVGKLYDSNKKPSENLRIANNKKNQRTELNNSNITSGFYYKKFIEESFRIMKKCNMFIWCSPMQILDIMNEIHKYNTNTIVILTWNKTNPIPTTNNNWLSDVEYCLYIRDNGVKLNNGYELKSKWYCSPINQKDKELYKHPTIKPLELVKRHLLHTTNENDVVLDCFCGSGTTCVACKETNRKYIGMEIDKDYYKIAINRLNGIDANGQISIFANFENLDNEEIK